MDNTNRAAYRINEFAEMLGVSRATIWNRIAAGQLKVVRFGGATLVPSSELDRLLKGEPAAPAA